VSCIYLEDHNIASVRDCIIINRLIVS